MSEAEALDQAWQGVFKAYNALEDIRPAGGFKEWHHKQRPGASREQIKEIMDKHDVAVSVTSTKLGLGAALKTKHNEVIDDLLALLNGKEGWCKCMDKIMELTSNIALSGISDHIKKWMFCPICSAPRPGDR